MDCVLLIPEEFPFDSDFDEEFYRGLPFLQIELATRADFSFMVNPIFASDRFQIPKGIIEVLF